MCEMFRIMGILRNKDESIHEQLCLLMGSHKTEEILGYKVTLFPGICEIYTPYREPKTGRSMNTGKIQLGEPMSFVGVTYKDDCITKVHPRMSVAQEN